MSLGALVLATAASGWATGDPERLARGKAIYEAACTLCHGRDGAGNPEWQSEVRPVPFNDCGTTAEPTELWEDIVRHGGPARGLSSVMPAFSEAYADEEIASVVAFLRTFCPKADAYPPGDLNFRRLLQTGKAFPEVEVVLRASHTPAEEDRQTGLEVLYENRLGTRFQYELVLPLSFQAPHDATGVGDIEIEGKQVLHFDLRRLQILSAGLGVTFPSGDDEKGLGAGTTVFTPFLSYGKGWGRRGRTFAQARLAAKIPAESDKSDPEVRWAAALSRALGPARIAWTPALELAGVWNTETGDHDWDVFLEVSKPLNRLGHVIAAGGVRIPVQPSDAHVSIEAYLLWDFGDGPFWAGW